VFLVGHVTKELPKPTPSKTGADFCAFNIATNEKYKKGDETVSRAFYHRVVAWGKKAEFCSKYLMKGTMVSVMGKLRPRVWDDKEGKTRRLTEVQIDEITLLGKRQDRQEEVEEEQPEEEEREEKREDPF